MEQASRRGLIDKVFNFFFNLKVIYVVLGVALLLFIIGMWHHYIYIDDCWHGEEAYWLAKDGVAKTKTMEGILGFENRIMVYHKLNIIFGAVIIKLFGWSVYYLKMFTFLVYMLFFLVLYRFHKLFQEQYNTRIFTLSVFAIFVSPLMIYLSFTYRPEILVMFFGFLSYYFLERYTSSNSYKWVVFSGISAGLAFFTHLNAMIFPIAGVILLLFNKQYKASVFFSIAAVCTCMLYTFDLWQGNNFQLFEYQINNWPSLELGKTYFDHNVFNLILKKLSNLLNEDQRFFWSEKVSMFSLLFFFSIIYKFKLLRTQYRSLLIYTITLILALSITGSHVAERYLLYYYPFMALIIAIALDSLLSSTKKLYAIKIFYILLFGAQLFFVGMQLADTYKNNADFPKIYHEVLSKIPDKDPKILGPDQLVFNEIENHRLLSYHAWKYYQERFPEMLDQTAILKRAVDLHVDYIVLDYFITHDASYSYFTNGVIYDNPYYEKFATKDDFIILKRKTPKLVGENKN